ncbi:MAG: lipoyl domain-containing protein [Thermodesulfobacteriota bacterium]
MNTSHVVLLPQLGGRGNLPAIVRAWFKEPGEWVALDDRLCMLETQKASYDVYSDGEGFLVWLVPVGGVVRRGERLAELSSEAGESVRSGARAR